MTSPGTVVIAIGGNALQPSGARAPIARQFHHTRLSLAAVVALAAEGWRIAIVHGNGPQVGDALLRNEDARERVEPLPLGVLVAATAGWIGYMVQQSLVNALHAARIQREVLTVVTQTVVDREAPGAMQPVKPIGHALALAEAAALEARGVPLGRDGAGRVRRLAPSPPPVDLVEAASIRRLVEAGHIVIAAGGGGTPVWREADGRWEGLDAVVDKDRVAAILGTRLGADTLLMLTDVDAVYTGWGGPAQRPLGRLGVAEAEALVAGGGLGAGSMRPKVDAGAAFVRAGGRRAVIAHLERGAEALAGTEGTTIVAE